MWNLIVSVPDDFFYLFTFLRPFLSTCAKSIIFDHYLRLVSG